MAGYFPASPRMTTVRSLVRSTCYCDVIHDINLSVTVYYTSYTAHDNELLIIVFHCGCIPNVVLMFRRGRVVPEDGGDM